MKPDEIRSLRKSRGWTQQQLAVKLGMSLPAVTRWEGGLHKPSALALEKLRRLAKKTK